MYKRKKKRRKKISEKKKQQRNDVAQLTLVKSSKFIVIVEIIKTTENQYNLEELEYLKILILPEKNLYVA